MQAATVGDHGARHAGGQHLGGGHGQAVQVGGTDGEHGHGFGRRALGVGQVRLADLFADRDHDALPADHGAKAQGDGHGDLDPEWNEMGGVIDLLLEGLQLGAGVAIEIANFVPFHQPDGFRGQVHVVAHVGHGFGRYTGQRAVTLDLAANVARQRRQGRYQLRGCLPGAHVVGKGGARVGGRGLRVAALQSLLGYLGDGGELHGLAFGHRAIEGVGHGQGADQNQHDQAHAFLAIVGAVGKGHTGAGEDQDGADPPGRRRFALGSLVQGAVL
ncbi:hypothetical protein D3C80_1253650 [compost metagenome]